MTIIEAQTIIVAKTSTYSLGYKFDVSNQFYPRSSPQRGVIAHVISNFLLSHFLWYTSISLFINCDVFHLSQTRASVLFLCTCSNLLNVHSHIFTKMGATSSPSLNLVPNLIQSGLSMHLPYSFLLFYRILIHLNCPTLYSVQNNKLNCNSLGFTC